MLVHENEYIRFAFEKPLLHVTILRNTSPSKEDWAFALQTLLQFYTACEQSKTRMAIRIDLRQMAMLSLERWRELAKTLDDVRERTHACVYGTCLVNESGMVRMAINGLLALYRPVRPMRFFATEELGMAWLQQLIAKEDSAAVATTNASSTASVSATLG